MRVPEWRPALTAAHDAALEWLEHLAERPVRPEVDYAAMYAVLHEPLPDEGLPAERVIAELDAAVRPGLMAMNHGRFFGWVIGGSTPAGVAADWLVAAWTRTPRWPSPHRASRPSRRSPPSGCWSCSICRRLRPWPLSPAPRSRTSCVSRPPVTGCWRTPGGTSKATAWWEPRLCPCWSVSSSTTRWARRYGSSASASRA